MFGKNKTKSNPYNALNNPVAYEEMNEQQKEEHLCIQVKRELLTAIQFMSMAYRSPAILDLIVEGVQLEILKAKEDGVSSMAEKDTAKS